MGYVEGAQGALELAAGVAAVVIGAWTKEAQGVSVDGLRQAEAFEGFAEVAEVGPGGVAGHEATGDIEAGMVIDGEQEGLFLAAGPPFVDGAVVLPEFAEAGAVEPPVGSRFALGAGDEVGQAALDVGLDGGAGAAQAVKTQEFVGDELVVGRGLQGDELVQEGDGLLGPGLAYAARLADVGGYPFVSTALVQNPTKDRTHYHLIYATRRIEGIEVFKAAERKALKLAPILRARAKDQREEERTGQRSLFDPTDLPDTAHLGHLKAHFERQAAEVMAHAFTGKDAVAYDELHALAMRFPIAQEGFIRDWLDAHGLQSNQQTTTPKPGRGIVFRRA